MASVLQIRADARPECIHRLRDAVGSLASEAGLSSVQVYAVKLCVSEAIANAVRHAYPESDCEVCVSYVVAEDSIVMIVEDQGAGIAPDESPEPKPAPLEGGMGISIISAVVDDLDVRAGADGRGTVVRMTKRLNVG